MLLRTDSEGVIAISQPAHAWVSGQLARQWGNAEFAQPREEVCFAASQHDIGFLDWEEAPTLNGATGLPHTFLDLPTRTHLQIWTKGIRHMLRFGRYPALLVSLHFTAIGQHALPDKEPADATLMREFLEQQDELQTTLLTSLRNDFNYEDLCIEEAVRENQELVSLWDWMSLLLCLKFGEEKILKDPPAGGSRKLKMTPLNKEASRVRVEPWPFGTDRVQVACEGRHLLKASADEKELRENLRAAAPVTIITELLPK